jgi:hypothetical protein
MKILKTVLLILLIASPALAIEDPPYLTVTKPTPSNTVTVCASGCDYSSLEAADSAASAGWLIQVKAGTYSWSSTWDSSGTLGNEIVIEAYGDGDAIIDVGSGSRFYVNGSYLIFDGGPDRELIFDGYDQGGGDKLVYPAGGTTNNTFFACSN